MTPMVDVPSNGSVISYPYLWAWQRDKGETEGRKERPVCMVLAIAKGSQTNLILLAISGTPPRSDQTALEIPQLECRRAGIRDWKDAWITVSEFNHDVAETSFHYDPNMEVLGSFSKGFLSKIAAAFKPYLATLSAKISRID
nr:plasmid maintenance toxin (PemK-like) [Rhizobium sp. P007]